MGVGLLCVVVHWRGCRGDIPYIIAKMSVRCVGDVGDVGV